LKTHAAETDLDTLLGGRLRLWQPARGCGYRFNLDPVILSGFVPPCRHLLELGSGCGVLGLLMLSRGLCKQLTAVEVQPQLAGLIERNAAENDLSGRVEVICGDLREVELPSADGVAFNAPYFPAGSGPGSKERGRDAGRFERHGTLADFVAAATFVLSGGGALSAIIRAERERDFRSALAECDLTARQRREVCSRRGQLAQHLLLGAESNGSGALHEHSPLYVHDDNTKDGFSTEVAALLA